MVTVILNGYKRPHALSLQLEAVKSQTLPATNIMMWQNKGGEFNSDLVNSTQHASCNSNLGVWARFSYALNAQTPYICILDDDTIPGSKWLENCYNTIQHYDGLLGTIGVKYKSDSAYFPNNRVGWANPNENTEQVDIVGHSWFFKREWLSTYWRELPEIGQSNLVGEDIHFSYTLQKYLNKSTFVPPHPLNDVEMWGSKPDTANSLGNGPDKVGISQSPEMFDLFNNVYSFYIKKGFKTLKNSI
jgi:hypothetical protein|tara:strand:+ start:122 stop:856 length:735 start_codon:yes stop_codon:yes gene_type:complete